MITQATLFDMASLGALIAFASPRGKVLHRLPLSAPSEAMSGRELRDEGIERVEAR